MGYAVVLGVFGAFAGLVFIGVINFGGNWYSDSDPGWFGGHWWWMAVTAAAGVVVGLLRRLTRLPEEVPGLIADLQDRARRPGTGAGDRGRLGGVADRRRQPRPGKGAGRRGRRGGQLDLPATGAQRRGLPGEHPGRFRRRLRRAVLQHGDRGAADPGGRPARAGSGSPRPWSRRSWPRASRSASTSPSPARCSWTTTRCRRTQFEDWQLLAAVPLGLFAAVVVTLLAGFMMVSARLFGRLKVPAIAKPALGGAVFGLVGVALPLTMFTGSDQLNTVLADAGTLGLGLLVALAHREDAHLRRQPGQRVRRRPDLPVAVHRRNGRGPRPPGHPRRATRPGVHLPARRRPRS